MSFDGRNGTKHRGYCPSRGRGDDREPRSQQPRNEGDRRPHRVTRVTRLYGGFSVVLGTGRRGRLLFPRASFGPNGVAHREEIESPSARPRGKVEHACASPPAASPR
ncbi:hypothetical protein MRX96_025384 [Rhipicephalus microplus]